MNWRILEAMLERVCYVPLQHRQSLACFYTYNLSSEMSSGTPMRRLRTGIFAGAGASPFVAGKHVLVMLPEFNSWPRA